MAQWTITLESGVALLKTRAVLDLTYYQRSENTHL